jgi:hypothetical protein
MNSGIILTDKYFLFIVVLDARKLLKAYSFIFWIKNLTTYNHSFIASLKE